MNHTPLLLDKEKGKDDAKIRYRIKWNANVVVFNVGYRVELTDPQRGKPNTVNKKEQYASVINGNIQSYEAATDKIFKTFEAANKIPAEEFRIVLHQGLGREKVGNELFDNFTNTLSFQNNWTAWYL